MPLPVGTRIGPFVIDAAIGAGGMGEVYRARDSKLGRDVALKVLPPLLAGDPERLARFEREAQVLASLNHPNIAQIHGVEDSGGVRALVMELVEGPTLEEVIATRVVARRDLSFDEAIKIAKEIAEALEAAHDQGIIHRDLKPANVKLRPDGTVKVLDFGLAKALDTGGGSSADAMASPTQLAHSTQEGLILGTAAYMSPEQARGRPVDRRTDIWAFGAVLYELLAGARMFPGETVSDALAAVLTKDPDWEKLPASTPDSVRTLIRRCVERDQRRRLQAIGEARIVLSDPGASTVRQPPRRSAARLAVLTTLVAVVSAAGGFLVRSLITGNSQQPEPLRKLDLAISGFQVQIDSPPVISPDGQSILYSASGQLWIRSLAEFAVKPVAGSVGGRYPFWSPDSREVAFVRDRKLWRAAVNENDATAVSPVPADLTGSGAGAWTTDGQILLAGGDTVGLLGVGANGGATREVVALRHPDESDFHEVTALPGDRGVVFTVHGPAGADKIDTFAGGTRKTVLHIPGENLRWPRYAAPGYLLYARESTSPGIWGIRFSLDRLETEGEPFLIVPNAAWPSVGADGTLAIVRGSDQPSEIISIDQKGNLQPIGVLQGQLLPINQWRTMSLSPDGKRIALTMTEPGGSELWSYEIGRGTMTRLSLGGQVVVAPTWSHDGSRVLFAAFAGHRAWNVFAVPSSETGTPKRVMPISNEMQWPCTISFDGRWLVYAQRSAGNTDLWLAPLDGTAGERLTKTPYQETEAQFSPDARLLAYTSDEPGRSEIYVRPFPLDAQRAQVSNGGGTTPVWSADGHEIFYRTPTGLSRARVTRTASGIEVREPVQLFPIAPDSRILNFFLLAPDGQHFLFARDSGADRLSVILNWTSQLNSDARAKSK